MGSGASVEHIGYEEAREEVNLHMTHVKHASVENVELLEQRILEKLHLDQSKEEIPEIAFETREVKPSKVEEKKKIILFMDGSGNYFTSPYPTNIVLLYQILEKNLESTNENYLLKYFPGVGTEKNKTVATADFLLAFGLKETLKEILGFIFSHYNGENDDELIIFGFSRGSFAVRALCGFLRWHGIPKDQSQIEIDTVLADYIAMCKTTANHSDIPSQANLDAFHVPVISFVGLFDTVPFVDDQVKEGYDYFFHVEDSAPMIRSVCHIMAEVTTIPFQSVSYFIQKDQYHGINASLENAPSDLQEIVYKTGQYLEFRQPGSHCNIGGGCSQDPWHNKVLSNRTLRLMLQASPFTSFVHHLTAEELPMLTDQDNVEDYIFRNTSEKDMKGREIRCHIYQFIEEAFADDRIPHRTETVVFASQQTTTTEVAE